VDELAASPGVDQVVETDPGNVTGFEQVKDRRDFRGIESIHGEPKADLDPCLLTGGNAVQGSGEGTLHSPEAIVHLFHAVKTDSDIGQPDHFELASNGRGDQGAVGGDDRPHAFLHRIGCQFLQIRAYQRFATGKQHDGAAESRQVVENLLALAGRELVRESLVAGMGVTVNTSEVAAASDIPHYHRLLVLGKLEQMRRQMLALAPVAQGVRGFHRTAVEFRDTDHVERFLVRLVVGGWGYREDACDNSPGSIHPGRHPVAVLPCGA